MKRQDPTPAHLLGYLGDGRPSSSNSMPSNVATMLGYLDIPSGAETGMRVLEVGTGTGTGWNAALLAARLDDDAVTTIETDPTVAAGARTALTTAGYAPHIVTGDGLHGYPPHAPYERIISTATARLAGTTLAVLNRSSIERPPRRGGRTPPTPITRRSYTWLTADRIYRSPGPITS